MAGIGIYTNLVNKILGRLNNASTLSTYRKQTGTKNGRLQSGDKLIQIEYGEPFIDEDYMRVRQNQKEGHCNLTLWVQTPKVRDKTNGMFNADTTTGVIPAMEDILDALNTQPPSTLNPQIEDASKSMALKVQNVIEHDSKTEFEIAIEITTTDFTINNRGNN